MILNLEGFKLVANNSENTLTHSNYTLTQKSHFVCKSKQSWLILIKFLD